MEARQSSSGDKRAKFIYEDAKLRHNEASPGKQVDEPKLSLL
jgi:hypothetical protein